MNFKTYWKETLYFVLSVILTVAVWAGLISVIIKAIETPAILSSALVFIIYFLFIALYLFFMKIVLIGHLQGNGVRITEKQFPEIFTILQEQCLQLKIRIIPTMYLVQSGGVLNAFATRYIGRDYVVIYSDVFEKAFSDGKDVVKFILAHELAHIKRKHMIKRFLILPANILFWLTLAYSRACEVTCDRFASRLAPDGDEDGLVLLAAGKTLFSHVNIPEYISESAKEKTFAKWFAEIVSTHPHITNRLRYLIENKKEKTGFANKTEKQEK